MLNPVNPALLLSLLQPVLQKVQQLKQKGPARTGESKPEQLFEQIVKLLKAQPPTTRVTIVQHFEQDHPEAAARLKDQLYTMDDLLLLEDRSLQALLKEVTSETLSRSLVGVGEPVQEKVLRNMSKRAREMLEEEMILAQSAGSAKIQDAQQLLLAEVLNLDRSGKLQWVS